MKIIQSHDIQGKLLDIILKAKKELVIVSPYVNLTYSKQVSAALVAARNRDVRIAFYIRDDANNWESKKQVQDMGFAPRLVPNLHAKLYFNEATGLITSLNLLSSSLGNSIEIGGQLETAEELDELRLFVAQFITPHEVGGPPAAPQVAASVSPPPAAPAPARPTQALAAPESAVHRQEFGALLADFLAKEVDPRCHVEGHRDGSLSIRALRNQFTATIESSRLVGGHQFYLLAVVSGAESDRFRGTVVKDFPSLGYTRFIQAGGEGYYDMLKAVRQVRLSAAAFNQLPLAEQHCLLQEVGAFLKETQAFKANTRR